MINATQLTSRFALDVQSTQQLKHRAAQGSDPKALREAAQQFEAQFLQKVLKSAHDASPASDLLKSQQSDFYNSLMDQQWAQHLAGKGTGLAEQLISQIEQQRGYGIHQGRESAENPIAGIPRAHPRELPPRAEVANAVARHIGQHRDVDSVSELPRPAAVMNRVMDNIAQRREVDPSVEVRPGAVIKAIATHIAQRNDMRVADAPTESTGEVDTAAEEASTVVVSNVDPSTESEALGEAVVATELTDEMGDVVETVSTEQTGREFVQNLRGHARAISEETGIPAKLMLAQAVLETGWGQRQIHHGDGRNSHNLFGIKAGDNWQGDTVSVVTHEYVNGEKETQVHKFRAYSSFRECFEDYAQLMTNNPRYEKVINALDNRAAAHAMQEAGYATDPGYSSKLIALMDQDVTPINA